ncbi:hypothetical protein Afil01_09090 [Actinorhabdospora filicis]|uniref:Uncharacterized protein n=1 Tax=Actinorhabdospora filicis TaxID=1785913 RepID=A0A9W6W1N7_9ACTN|nr:hypothetical protein Afil01_09090 [Actinorhabdospora filicis]
MKKHDRNTERLRAAIERLERGEGVERDLFEGEQTDRRRRQDPGTPDSPCPKPTRRRTQDANQAGCDA